MKIEDLLREADSIIEKKAHTNEPKVQAVTSDDEVTKLANLLLKEDQTISEGLNKKASVSEEKPTEQDLHVKIASALVIAEVLNNVEKFEKIAQFEEKAKAAGYSQVDIDKFIVEKFL